MSEKDKEEHELEKIRLQKLQKIMEKQKMQETVAKEQQVLYDKVELVLKQAMMSDAYNYLNRIKSLEPNVYWSIYNQLVSQKVINNIDLLLMLIRNGEVVLRKIPLEAIQYLERKAKGIKSTIKVKRANEEAVDLASYLK